MARSSDSNFLISLLRDKTFQAREIRRVIKLSILYLAVTTALLGVFYYQIVGTLLQGVAPLLFVSEDIAMVNEAMPTMATVLGQWMLAMLGINTLITIGLGIYITRKLGHPIMAIKRALREVGNGNMDVRLRSSDKSEFGEISSELSAAMHSVRTQIAAAKHSIEAATTIRSEPSTTSTEQDVDGALNNCRSALDFFHVQDTKLNLQAGPLNLVDDDDDAGRKVA